MDLSVFDDEKTNPHGLDLSSFDQDPEGPSKMESLGRGLSQGASLGFQDEISPAFERLFSNVLGDQATQDIYKTKTYEDLRNSYRQQNAQAQDSNPATYALSELGGNIATTAPISLATGGASLGTNLGISGGTGAINSAGLSNEDSAAGVARDATLGGLFSAGTTAALSGVGKVYDAVKPLAKSAFSKIRGISPETIDLYSNPGTKQLINSIGSDFHNVRAGQIDNAERVAQQIQNARSEFVKGRLSSIDREIDSATERAQPIRIQSLMDTLSDEEGKMLPVGSANKSGLSKLGEIRQDIQSLAKQNVSATMPGQETRFGTFNGIRRGDYEIPTRANAGFNQNALDFEKSAAYLPEAEKIVPKVPGGPKDFHTALTEQAGDVRSYDPIMGPRRNLSASSLRMQKKDGVRLQSNIDRPDQILPLEVGDVSEYITPKQANRLRVSLNDEGKAAFTSNAGDFLPGATAVNRAGDQVRSMLDEISPNIRSENSRLADLFNVEDSLKRGGLQGKEIDPNRLVDLLTAGPNRAAKDTAGIESLDSLLGTNLKQERSVARAATELNPESPFAKIATGHSLYPVVTALAATPIIGPVLASGAALTGAAIASPALTKPIITAGVGVDKIMNAARRGLIGKYSSVLAKALQSGPQQFAISHYVLQQTDPEYRKAIKPFTGEK